MPVRATSQHLRGPHSDRRMSSNTHALGAQSSNHRSAVPAIRRKALSHKQTIADLFDQKIDPDPFKKSGDRLGSPIRNTQ